MLILFLFTPLFCSSQDVGNSLTIGLEAYRPWTVSPTGVADLPVSMRFSQAILPNWRLAMTLGWESSRELGVDAIRFENQFVDNTGKLVTRSHDEETTIEDQVVSLSVGTRFLIPGEANRLRMFLGVDLLSAYYPNRRVQVDSRTEDQYEATGEILALAASQSTGTGYEGYGFGVQGSIGVEVVLIDGLLCGLEFGPGRFARFREINHDFVTQGVQRRAPLPADLVAFENERTQAMGQESQSNVRFRGMMYVGWEL